VRAIAIANGKGGVGKTTITANLSGLLAAAGYRVLAVDTDPQGNLARDLAYEGDGGQSLALAIQHGKPLEPLREVRPNLDVVAGGEALADVAAVAISRSSRGGDLTAVLATRLPQLTTIAGEPYDFVLIDTPPGDRVLIGIALAAADYLLIPSRSDEASIDGLAVVAERFVAARERNPGLQLLGVALFGTTSRSRRLRDLVRRSIDAILEGVAPVLDSEIRYLESAAVDARRRGQLIHELEGAQAQAKTARLQRLRLGRHAGEELLSRDATALAGDYQDLAEELIRRIAVLEQVPA
jgi:chromosome partitioning protein